MQPQGDGLDATFAALADPTRRAILARLASGEASVMELAEPFAMTQPAISARGVNFARPGCATAAPAARREAARGSDAVVRKLPALGEFVQAAGWLAGGTQDPRKETPAHEAVRGNPR
jgi:hypothetical protein